jgi:hypothetical protein
MMNGVIDRRGIGARERAQLRQPLETRSPLRHHLGVAADQRHL